MINLYINLMKQQTQHSLHNNPTIVNFYHIIAFFLMSYGYYSSAFINFSWHIYIKFLTMQGYFITFVTYFYYFIVIFFPSLLKRSISQKLFQLSFCLQVIITFGFWTILYIPMVKSNNFSNQQIRFNQFIHSVPFLLNIIDIVVLNPKFHKKDNKIILAFTIFSIIINAYYSIYDKPVYFFITYQHYYQLIILILGALFILGTHYMGLKLYHHRENKRIKKIEKKQGIQIKKHHT